MIRITGSLCHLQSGASRFGSAPSRQIFRRAVALKRNGALRGDHAVLAQEGKPDSFVNLFAVWLLWAAAVLVNPKLPDQELARLVEFSKARFVIGPDSTAPARVRRFEACGIQKSTNLGPDGGAALDHAALILFTSGSTGQPKGVGHSRRSILARVTLNKVHMGRDCRQTTLSTLPVSFGHGLIGNRLTPIAGRWDDPSRCRYGASAGIQPQPDPAGSQHPRHELGSRTLETCAAWLVRQAIDAGKDPHRFGPLVEWPLAGVIEWGGCDTVVNMYGMTEAANRVGGASSREMTLEDGVVGRLWGGAAAVLTSDHRVLRRGEGELLFQTPTLMTGYLDRPQKTQEFSTKDDTAPAIWGRSTAMVLSV
ncbi:AMP-binding protein [Roseobacter sinensis]|uniref:Acyl--CoA ligase n=1 Tax=Roseobacter sinensis TaxID=2931391 RepID=A0ABT3BK02_9RHOB|nr:class I adenylate-forming enzyme family protein [Roseobacter sp. WL0113]MCV3273434.1 acyl--CoA ligase [Roseobacter sp. WL0113]